MSRQCLRPPRWQGIGGKLDGRTIRGAEAECRCGVRNGSRGRAGTAARDGAAGRLPALGYLRRFLLTASFSSLPGLKRTLLLALMVIDWPVAGLRPFRAARSERLKLPKPGSLAPSPPFTPSAMTAPPPAHAS